MTARRPRRALGHRLPAGLVGAGLLALALNALGPHVGGAAAPALAQRSALEAATIDELAARRLAAELRDGDLDAVSPAAFDETIWAEAALSAVRSRRYVRARELAEDILQIDPASVPGDVLIGMVFHRGEGSLPRALYHLDRARERIETGWGPTPTDDGPWRWHALALSELAMVTGEMGRHERRVELLRQRAALYAPSYPADLGWPLMRLRRYDAAREVVETALASEDEAQISMALTALCAIEAEQQRRVESYEACRAAADHERTSAFVGPTSFTNAAEAAIGLLRFDEVERLLLEGSEHFAFGAVANPWLDLVHLYLAQGRTAEALDAVRRMRDWRLRQPAFLDEQNRAETQMAAAAFLIVAGRGQEAAELTRRILQRPDRTGFTSSESEQMEAAAAVLDAVAHRLAAEEVAERAAASLWRERPALWARETSLRLRAWSSSRRAAALSADRRRLLATLRPYLAGSLELPEWLEPEMVDMLGAGVVASALDAAIAEENLDAADGYFTAARVEIVRGAPLTALALAEQALLQLPESEVLLRARIAARGAQAARRLGNRRRATELLDQAMQLDPGVVRRLGGALTVVLESNNTPASRAATAALRRSPRFRVDPGGEFRLRIGGSEERADGCLLGLAATRLACTSVSRRAGEDGAALGRRLAIELQRAAFAPRLDLTQADLQSLDGSPTAAGGPAGEDLRSILSFVTED
ncbi:MAG: hypothetical protein AAGN46_10970 [Acidobacteriota bacterium]